MTDSGDLAFIGDERFSGAVSQFLGLANNSDALTFLMGAGCSKCAGLPLTNELTDKVLVSQKVESRSKEILAAVKEQFDDGVGANIEDYLSEIVDLLAITERRAGREVKKNTVSVGGAAYTADNLRDTSNQIKRAIASAIESKVNVDIHQTFVSSIHRPIRVGRQGPSQPVNYLVLNYDTIVEDALAMLSIPYADGLTGGATAWWDPHTFETPGISARVIKLHGSIDWYQISGETMPRRIGGSIQIPDQENVPLLIWPSSTKYQEAQLDPFAQLLDQARKAMRPTLGAQRLLVICGYSFGDSHINLEIDKALRESRGNLTIAAFTDRDQPEGRLSEWREDSSVREQVLVFANRGFFHGDTLATSDTGLPWWKFENLTKILNGEVQA